MESEETSNIPIYCDFIPNHANDPHLSLVLKESLIEKYKNEVDTEISRIATLPILMAHPIGEYIELLVEARKVYSLGFFYSCVAMCGISAERITKDILSKVIAIKKTAEDTITPSIKAFEQLELVDLSSLIRFLFESEVISQKALKSVKNLIELRNQYAHARGKSPQKDALTAITELHSYIDETLSVLKYYEIQNGHLVPKPAQP